jgi:O-antigen ligase
VQFFSALLAAVLTSDVLWRRRTIPKFDGFDAAMLGFACLTLLSSIRSFWPLLSAAKTCAFLSVFLAAAFSCARVGAQNVFRLLYISIIALLCLGLILGSLGVFPLFSADDYSGRTRFSMFALHPGVIADLCAYCILMSRFFPRKPPLLLTAVLLVMNVLTSAKTSIIALTVAWIVSAALWQRITLRGLAIGILGFTGAILSGWIVLNNLDPRWLSDGPLATLYGTNLTEEVTTVNGRVDLWKSTAPLAYSSLVLGHGFDGVREALMGKFEWAGNSHNSILELVLAAGVPGACLYLVAWGLAIRRATHARDPHRTRVLGIHVYFLVTSISAPIWTTSQFVALFVLTVLNAAAREYQEDSSAVPTPALVRVRERTSSFGIVQAEVPR